MKKIKEIKMNTDGIIMSILMAGILAVSIIMFIKWISIA